MTNLQELKQWVEMMETYPAVGKNLKLKRNVAVLTDKAQGLRQEISELEKQKASLIT